MVVVAYASLTEQVLSGFLDIEVGHLVDEWGKISTPDLRYKRCSLSVAIA
jgi:hypothetical protein